MAVIYVYTGAMPAITKAASVEIVLYALVI
jgi:hypothetical protein